MSISAAFIVPHPPLIVPDVGRGQEQAVQRTIDGYHAAAQHISELAPETIIIISPHAAAYKDYIHISPGKQAQGSLERFGATDMFHADCDAELAEYINRLCRDAGFPGGTSGGQNSDLDHGTLVPMYFINQYLSEYKLVRCGISGLTRAQHYQMGMYMAEAAEALGRRTVIVASGDLSHKLKSNGPYGFAPEGPQLDEKLIAGMITADFSIFLNIDPTLCELGAECGLRSFIIMAGALDKKDLEPYFHSYEGPMGVGYAVSSFVVSGDNPDRCFMPRANGESSPYALLARQTLENYVSTGHVLNLPNNLPSEMLANRAGVFVSIKKDGQLRGCIGTTEPTQPNIAREIQANAISAGTKDPRFQPVHQTELPMLSYSVDVLSPPEPIAGKNDLNTKIYGVIVSSGGKRGLLLPNLEGVDTADEQIDIACRKAGIAHGEAYTLERFQVVRHK